MMLLSRFWYAVLGLFLAAALYVAYLAVGQYNRRNSVALNELVASDSQTVGWALQIDARRRLDALLVGAVDKGVQDALIAANGRDPVPPNARSGARKALASVLEKTPQEYRADALFAVDREGRVVGQIGYDAAQAFEDFELGGYAAVNDALHGYLRDDTWVWGGRIYRVVARPVEYDVTQAPVGAIVGLRLVDPKFAQEIARRTRANVAFYSAGQRVASASGTDGFEDNAFEQVSADMANLENDKSYKETGRSEVRSLTPSVGGMYAKLIGEAYDLGAGYVVLRSKVTIASPTGFLSNADDKDKASVPTALIVVLALLGIGVGFALSFLEHTLPLKQMEGQAQDLKTGKIDLLQLAKFRGAYRLIAQDLNAGIERVAEKGGAPRKTADLEQILGPTPAQPAMSAFSFPQDGFNNAAPSGPNPSLGLGASGGRPQVTPSGGGPSLPKPSPGASLAASGSVPKVVPPPPKPPAVRPAPSSPNAAAVSAAPLATEDEDDEATMVAAVPKEVLAAATGEHRAFAGDETSEWLSVYEDFLRTKRQCGEPTDGLTFEKFQHTLRKNRDALMARHGCKRVKFSVYVKEGKASLKATPVKD